MINSTPTTGSYVTSSLAPTPPVGFIAVPVPVLHALITAATIEPKTGLLPCHTWSARAAARLQHGEAAAGDCDLALLVVDVDGFAVVNTRIGHLAADLILRDIAAALRAAAGPDALVGRFGGDEFVVLVPTDDPAALGGRVCASVSHLTVYDDGSEDPHAVGLTVSAGIATCAGSAPDLTVLLWAADRALYVAKRAGGNTSRTAAT